MRLADAGVLGVGVVLAGGAVVSEPLAAAAKLGLAVVAAAAAGTGAGPGEGVDAETAGGAVVVAVSGLEGFVLVGVDLLFSACFSGRAS